MLDAIRRLEEKGSSGLVRRVLESYMKQTPRLLSDSEQAIEDGRGDAIQKVSHSLRSSSVTVGAMKLSSLCRDLETGNGAATPSRISHLFAEIAQEYEHVSNELGKEL